MPEFSLDSLFWAIVALTGLLIIRPIITRAHSLTLKIKDWVEVSVTGSSQSPFKESREGMAPAAADQGGRPETGEASGLSPTKRILWVDDRPHTNASEIARLRDAGVEIEYATSTEEALQKLRSSAAHYDVVISDMKREERGIEQPRAGLELLDKIRAERDTLPVLIYCGEKSVKALKREVLTSRGDGITASQDKLFEMLKQLGIPTVPAGN